MTTEIPATALRLESKIRADAKLELSLNEIAVAEPGEGQVLVRIEASPINPSDLGLLFGPADMRTAIAGGSADRPSITADVPDVAMGRLAARLGEGMPVGNEGAGIVVKAGAGQAAQALLGKTVAFVGGGMYAQYRLVSAPLCLLLPDGTKPSEAASCFVNPLTSLGMVETMRLEGHSALVHTAAASNLGQMLQKVCNADGIPLINIVRKSAHVDLLKSLGAEYICNTTDDDFEAELIAALKATGATLAFDAIGGGALAGRILSCMERALNSSATEFSRYGSTTHKQVYIYGGLDRSPTELGRDFGMAWGVGGWLLTPFLQRIGGEAANELRDRIAREIKTTFASHYTQEVSLAEALSLDAIAVYGRQATGEKYLINPNKGL